MITGPFIAEIAGLVGEPARATMLTALLDGRALTATDLAYAARVTPPTASTHLAELTEARLVAPQRDGRYRHCRLASPLVAQMLDGIMAVALEHRPRYRPRYRPLSRQARELSAARICYDHLAGRLSVDLTDSFITHEYIVVGDEAAEITPAGTRFLTELGLDLPALSSRRRHFCRLCSFGPPKHIDAGVLNIGHAAAGPDDGRPAILLHGWPYDIQSYVDVAPLLASAGYRVIVPYLRGHGPTRFLSGETLRNGQQSALAVDVIALLDALRIEKAILASFDWGARTADIVAALLT